MHRRELLATLSGATALPDRPFPGSDFVQNVTECRPLLA